MVQHKFILEVKKIILDVTNAGGKLMVTKSEKPFRRLCRTCGEMFIRTGIKTFHCQSCLEKKRKSNYLKLKTYWEHK